MCVVPASNSWRSSTFRDSELRACRANRSRARGSRIERPTSESVAARQRHELTVERLTCPVDHGPHLRAGVRRFLANTEGGPFDGNSVLTLSGSHDA